MKTAPTPAFLMANVGSEASQIFSYLERNDMPLARSAAARAKRIIEKLLAHPDLQGRTGEVEILREILGDVFADAQKRRFLVSKKELEDYFLPFSLRVLSEQRIT